MSATTENPWLRIDLSDNAKVAITINIEVARSAAIVWKQMENWKSWMCHDPFHSRIEATEATLRAGAEVKILHGIGGIGFWRRGRILEVRSGEGFSFSDLSIAGVPSTFPHIYRYDIVACDEKRSIIRVSVKGRWTASFLPRSVVFDWLVLVSLGIWLGIQLNSLLFAIRNEIRTTWNAWHGIE